MSRAVAPLSPRALGSRRDGPVQPRLILVASDINPVVHAHQRHSSGKLHVRAAAGYAADGHEEGAPTPRRAAADAAVDAATPSATTNDASDARRGHHGTAPGRHAAYHWHRRQGRFS
jgi:hypothetical protein